MAVNQGSPGVRVLVTGAAGSRGPHLTRAPLALGYSVNGLDLDAPNHAAALWSGMDQPNSRHVWRGAQGIQPADIAGHRVVGVGGFGRVVRHFRNGWGRISKDILRSSRWTPRRLISWTKGNRLQVEQVPALALEERGKEAPYDREG